MAPPRYDDEGNPLPRNLTDVKNDGRELGEAIATIGDEDEKALAKKLVTELDQVVLECIEYEKTNEKITEENERNAQENTGLSAEISQEEEELNKQKKEIDDQLQSIEDELAAAQAALSDPPTPEELALIKELEDMRAGLLRARTELQTDRERLQKCSTNSNRVLENCTTIRNDCNEVRQRIFEACNPGGGGFGLGGGGSGGGGGGGGGAVNIAAMLLAALIEEVQRMTELRDYLESKVPQIQAHHDENTALLAETKQEVKEIKQNTVERGDMLASNKDRLNEIKAARTAKQGLTSGPGVTQPQQGTARKITITPLSNTAAKPSVDVRKSMEKSSAPTGERPSQNSPK